MHRMTKGILLAALLVWAAQAKADDARCKGEPPAKLNLERAAHFVDPKTDDRVEIVVTGSCWKAPFRWRLRVVVGGKEVFSRETSDERIDPFFADSGFVNDKCRGYLECKQQYYLKDLLDSSVEHTSAEALKSILDPTNPGSLYRVAKRELQERYGLSESQASAVATDMASRLRGGADLLNVPVSPVQVEFPRMFVPQVGAFVTVYEW